MKALLPLLAMLTLFACAEEPPSLIQATFPLNGSTEINGEVKPSIQLVGDISVEASNRNVVLYDVTQGARKTVSGGIQLERQADQTTLIYVAELPLAAGHDYILEVLRTTLGGEQATNEIDASEWPPEPLAGWPFQLWFSTKARPRVRAAYLEHEPAGDRIYVYFSQAMDPLSTAAALQLLDAEQTALSIFSAIWINERTVCLELDQRLDESLLYTVRIGQGARSESNVLLDGDDDGLVGEPEDAFEARFTGYQTIIRSRLAVP